MFIFSAVLLKRILRASCRVCDVWFCLFSSIIIHNPKGVGLVNILHLSMQKMCSYNFSGTLNFFFDHYLNWFFSVFFLDLPLMIVMYVCCICLVAAAGRRRQENDLFARRNCDNMIWIDIWRVLCTRCAAAAVLMMLTVLCICVYVRTCVVCVCAITCTYDAVQVPNNVSVMCCFIKSIWNLNGSVRGVCVCVRILNYCRRIFDICLWCVSRCCQFCFLTIVFSHEEREHMVVRRLKILNFFNRF